MKNLQNILLENMRRLGVKNLTKTDIQRLTLLEQETKEKSLTKRINFPSGMHSAQRGNVSGILGPQLQEMQDFLVANKGAVVEIILSSSESQVTNYDGETNPKTPLKPGQLSQMRYKTIETYMTQWLQGLLQQGIITNMPVIKQETPIIAGPEWKVIPGETPEQTRNRARSDQYTQHQWLQVTLKVVATSDEDIPLEVLATTSTTRNEESTYNRYNAQALFYFKSYAAAAALNRDPNSLPGALLTMNRYFELRESISLPKFKLPAFKMSIDGGTPVPVLIMPDEAQVGKPDSNVLLDNRKQLMKYTAYVGNSYKLIPPFQPGTPEYKNAWIFAYWYIMSIYPNDWQYISNKPKDIDFTVLQKKLTNNQKTKVFDATPALQEAWWKQYDINWYKGELDRVYNS